MARFRSSDIENDSSMPNSKRGGSYDQSAWQHHELNDIKQ